MPITNSSLLLIGGAKHVSKIHMEELYSGFKFNTNDDTKITLLRVSTIPKNYLSTTVDLPLAHANNRLYSNAMIIKC